MEDKNGGKVQERPLIHPKPEYNPAPGSSSLLSSKLHKVLIHKSGIHTSNGNAGRGAVPEVRF